MSGMRAIGRLATSVAVAVAIGTVCVSVLATENAVHIWNHPRPSPGDAAALAKSGGATWQTAQITAADGAVLDGWLFTPPKPNGAAVILLHGVNNSRLGMSGQARFLLRDGYTVLLPDIRGHGLSGGAILTYGIRESGDVHAWVDWLLAPRPGYRLYGLGASLGAAILLQSLAVEPRFRAMVADSPFADFREVALDRMSQDSGFPRPAFQPVVAGGFLYARMRYGIDMRHASPAAVVRSTHVPVLLIHGLLDTNIPISHSRELHAANPTDTVLWEVEGAHHVDSLSTAPAEYQRRVREWFAGH